MHTIIRQNGCAAEMKSEGEKMATATATKVKRDGAKKNETAKRTGLIRNAANAQR